TVPFSVWTWGENRIPLESTNVSITRFNESIAQAYTNIAGNCEFQLEAGLDYNVTAVLAENQSSIQTWDVLLNDSITMTFDFLDFYELNVNVFDGTSLNNSENGLTDCDVVILKNSSQIASGKTNISGKVTFQLSEPGLYEVKAKKGDFQNLKYLTIRHKNKTCNISLGYVYISILTQSIDGYPVSEVEASLISNNGTFSKKTDSNGFVEFFVPVSRYTLQINKESFSFQEEITFHKSQRISIVKIIELAGNLSIILTNQFSQKIIKANVMLTNDFYDLEFSGFTDENGKVTFYTIPWANYSVNIIFIDESFPMIIIELAQSEISIPLQVETINPILNVEGINWNTGSSFSVVLSSQFVSSFLQTTLAIILTTLTSLVIIISVLSLLSITSVISQPIVSNERSLVTFKRLGATKNQVAFGVVIRLSILGVIASILGSLAGMWVMTIFPMLKNVYIGGIIIRPRIDLWLLSLIVLSNLGVIILKSSQKVRQLHTLY
ncbi:MAG: FtsX-like permease family protein, partial [Candidatus Thorarchaeota archaeon]